MNQQYNSSVISRKDIAVIQMNVLDEANACSVYVFHTKIKHAFKLAFTDWTHMKNDKKYTYAASSLIAKLQ